MPCVCLAAPIRPYPVYTNSTDHINLANSFPITGFFGLFQYMCPANTILTANHAQAYEDTQQHVLHNALVCTGIPGAYQLVNTVQSVVVSKVIGKEGFVSGWYGSMRVNLRIATNHLIWNVFIECASFEQQNSDFNGKFFSEPETCHQCIAENGAKLQLGAFLRLLLPTRTQPTPAPLGVFEDFGPQPPLQVFEAPHPPTGT